MKQSILILSIFTSILFLTSCSNDPAIETNTSETPFVDDANAEVTAADTSATGVYQEEVIETEEYTLKDALKNNNNEITIPESSMSFCDCVKKQKKLENTIMETEDDAVMDDAMLELEKMRAGECNFLFSEQQNTVEEKQAHERKVKNCL